MDVPYFDEVSIRLCNEDDSENIGKVIYEAFSREALSMSVNYTIDSSKEFWYQEGKVSPCEKITLAAVPKDNSTVILGLLIIEVVSIDEANAEVGQNLDPIEMLLLHVRIAFWKQLLQRYPAEKDKLIIKNRYFRLSYLAVSPSASGRGIGGKLVERIPQFIMDWKKKSDDKLSSSQSDKSFFVYAETSSTVSQKICAAHGFEFWESFPYEEHRKRYMQAVQHASIVQVGSTGDAYLTMSSVVGQESMHLQVMFFHGT